MSFIDKLFGDPNAKIVKSLQPIIDAINGLEGKIKALSGEELKVLVNSFKEKLAGKDWAEQKLIWMKSCRKLLRLFGSLLSEFWDNGIMTSS